MKKQKQKCKCNCDKCNCVCNKIQQGWNWLKDCGRWVYTWW